MDVNRIFCIWLGILVAIEAFYFTIFRRNNLQEDSLMAFWILVCCIPFGILLTLYVCLYKPSHKPLILWRV